jgi:hypothetical protein
MAKFDINKFSTVDKVLGGAGVLGLIALFLPWYGASGGGFSASVSGWSTSYGWLGALLIIAAAAYLVLQRSEVDLSKMPLTPLVIILGASVLGTLIVALRWATLPSGHVGIRGFGYSYGPSVGIILEIIAGVVEVVCAVMMFRSSGEKLPWASKPSGQPPATPPPSS